MRIFVSTINTENSIFQEKNECIFHKFCTLEVLYLFESMLPTFTMAEDMFSFEKYNNEHPSNFQIPSPRVGTFI